MLKHPESSLSAAGALGVWGTPKALPGLLEAYKQADNDKDKGKDKDKHQEQYQGQYDNQHKGQYQDGENHGQVVSECNHQANQRNLKGQDRKDFTEWCQSRGERYKYDYNRYGSEKTCYQKANNKGLKGDKRANFLDKCFAGELGKKKQD